MNSIAAQVVKSIKKEYSVYVIHIIEHNTEDTGPIIIY